jgi:DNA-binding winged helix-turn-helix (wHTH) protein/Tol biopolymer transport system component
MDEQGLIRAAESEREPALLRFGVFEMDLRSGELRRSGALVKLAPQPFLLLGLLARSRGGVLTRDDIRKRLWGDGTYVDFDQRLNSCVNQIRQALTDDAEAPRFIETLPKRGYRWLADSEELPARSDRPALHVVVPFGARGEGAAAALPQPEPAPAPRTSAHVRRLMVAAPWAISAAALAAAAYLAATRPAPNGTANWRRITFQRGTVQAARFGAGGEIVYRAAWGTAGLETFAATLQSPDARRLELPPLFQPLAVSARGELAYLRPEASALTLSRVPLAGGAPRDVMKGVQLADWMPDGNDFAVVRFVDGRRRLEFPIGHDQGEVDWASALRVSPDGARVALFQHPFVGDDAGHVMVVDRSGVRRRVSTHFGSLGGLAWSPSGDEVWFGGARSGSLLGVQAATLSGRERTLLQTGSRIIVHDVDASGRVLLDAGTTRIGVRAADARGKECELSWLDSTSAIQITRDGSRVLLVESGDGGGPEYGIYLRPLDGAPPVKLGSGRATDISPDGEWVLAIPIRDQRSIELIPTGPGRRRALKLDGFARFDWAGFLGDARRILFIGSRTGSEAWEAYTYDLEAAAAPRRIGSFSSKRAVVSADGKRLVKRCSTGQCVLDLESLEETPLPGMSGDAALFWDADNRHLFMRQPRPMPAMVSRVDSRTGQRTPWRELLPPDAVGVAGIADIVGTPDGKAYAYTYYRRLSELFVVEGLR